MVAVYLRAPRQSFSGREDAFRDPNTAGQRSHRIEEVGIQARSMPEHDEELISSQPADLSTAGEVTAYRSTWLVSSRDVVRAAGYYDGYCAAIRRMDREEEPGAEETLLSMLANVWIPVRIARVHYRACGESGISESEMQKARITADGGQVRRTWHAQIIAAAQKPDAAAWPLLAQIPKWWPRSAMGGGVAVYRQGAMQARIEYRGCSLLDIPFFRDSTKGVLEMFLGHFCKDLTVSVSGNQKQGQASFNFRWR